MRPEEKLACARALIDNPLFGELMDEMEKLAIDQCVNAKPTDNDLRAAMAAEIRAIRGLRRKIIVLIEEANTQSYDAPA